MSCSYTLNSIKRILQLGFFSRFSFPLSSFSHSLAPPPYLSPFSPSPFLPFSYNTHKPSMAEHDHRETEALLEAERGGPRRLVRVTQSQSHYEPQSKWAGIRRKVRQLIVLLKALFNSWFGHCDACVPTRYIFLCFALYTRHMPSAYSIKPNRSPSLCYVFDMACAKSSSARHSPSSWALPSWLPLVLVPLPSWYSRTTTRGSPCPSDGVLA